MRGPHNGAAYPLDPEARALVDRWVAELGRAPAETVAVFRSPVAMVRVLAG